MITTFGLIGSGWRAEFYIRIAKALPEQFALSAVLIRDRQKGKAFSDKFGVKVVNSLDDFLALEPSFTVLSIKRGIVSGYLAKLFQAGMPVLCETPPGESAEDLAYVWEQAEKYQARIQVAEQYPFQPLYAAWKQAIDRGLLGMVQNINISALHGYHGVCMIRRMLGINYHNCCIYGKRYSFQVTETYGREGMAFDGAVIPCTRDRLTLEFDNGKIAFFDFSDPAQYHSFIRTRQLSIQGTRGEIDDLTIRYLNQGNIPVTAELNRIDLGIYNNQDWSHFGIMLGEEFLYHSPFPGARLNDDEIAVGSCLKAMAEFLRTGTTFYSLEEALQDMYISLMMDQALAQPYTKIQTETCVWADR